MDEPSVLCIPYHRVRGIRSDGVLDSESIARHKASLRRFQFLDRSLVLAFADCLLFFPARQGTIRTSSRSFNVVLVVSQFASACPTLQWHFDKKQF